jgi:hypothetical protein
MCERQRFTAGDYNGNTRYIGCDIHGVPELPSSSGTIAGTWKLRTADEYQNEVGKATTMS